MAAWVTPSMMSVGAANEIKFVSDVTQRMNRALRAMQTQITRTAAESVTVVGLDLLRRIQQKTPVDTGRLRNSFHLVPPRSPSDPGGRYQDNRGESFEDPLSNGRTGPAEVIVGTAVSYAIYIEAGHSRQAPLGMVSVSLLEITGQMERALTAKLGKRWKEAIG